MVSGPRSTRVRNQWLKQIGGMAGGRGNVSAYLFFVTSEQLACTHTVGIGAACRRAVLDAVERRLPTTGDVAGGTQSIMSEGEVRVEGPVVGLSFEEGRDFCVESTSRVISERMGVKGEEEGYKPGGCRPGGGGGSRGSRGCKLG